MNEVVLDPLRLLELQQLPLEIAQVAEKAILPLASFRAGAEMDHAHVLARGNDVRAVAVRATGKDVDEIAPPAHLAAELAHVDVHAAGLPISQRRQRRRVRANDGDALH